MSVSTRRPAAGRLELAPADFTVAEQPTSEPFSRQRPVGACGRDAVVCHELGTTSRAIFPQQWDHPVTSKGPLGFLRESLGLGAAARRESATPSHTAARRVAAHPPRAGVGRTFARVARNSTRSARASRSIRSGKAASGRPCPRQLCLAACHHRCDDHRVEMAVELGDQTIAHRQHAPSLPPLPQGMQPTQPRQRVRGPRVRVPGLGSSA